MVFKSYKRKPVEIKAAKLTKEFYDVVYMQENQEIHINGFILKAAKINEPKIQCLDESSAVEADDYVSCFLVQTLEDVPESLHRAEIGDYLIVGVKGEIYACKPDIFDLTYEEIENAEVSEKI